MDQPAASVQRRIQLLLSRHGEISRNRACLLGRSSTVTASGSIPEEGPEASFADTGIQALYRFSQSPLTVKAVQLHVFHHIGQ